MISLTLVALVLMVFFKVSIQLASRALLHVVYGVTSEIPVRRLVSLVQTSFLTAPYGTIPIFLTEPIFPNGQDIVILFRSTGTEVHYIVEYPRLPREYLSYLVGAV